MTSASTPLFGSFAGCVERFVQHGAVREDGHVAAGADHVRRLEGHDVVAVGNLALRRAVDPLRLEEDDGIRVTDGREEQPLRVVRVGGDHDLEARHADERGLRVLRMIVTTADAAADRRSNHDFAEYSPPER